MPYVLDFEARVGSAAPFRNIADAVREVAERTNVSSGNVRAFNELLNATAQRTGGVSSALKELATKQNIYKDFAKDVQGFVKEQERAQAEVQKMGRIMEQAWAENEKRAKRATDAQRKLATEQANFTKNLIQSTAGTSSLPGGAAGANLLARFGGAEAIGGAAAVAAIAAVTSEIVKLANETGQYAREQQNLASRTGLTLQETQQFSQIAAIAGVNVGSLTTMMRTLSKGMAENSSEGRLAKQAFKELGIDASVAFMAPGQALTEIFAALENVHSATDRDRLAIALFGRGGLELLPMVDHFKELSQAVSHAGTTMENEGVKAAADYKREIDLLDQQFQALRRTFGLGAIGIIQIVLGQGDVGGGIKKKVLGGLSFIDKAGGVAAAILGIDRADPGKPDEAEERTRKAAKAGNAFIADQEAKSKQATSERIQKTLRSGAGKIGQQEGLQMDLRNAEGDLAAAIDKQDEKGVKLANDKVIALKEQLKALGQQKSVLESIAEFEKRMDEKSLNPVEKIASEAEDLIRKKGLKGAAAQQVRDAALRGELAEVAKERDAQKLKYVDEKTGNLFPERATELAPDEKSGGLNLEKGVERNVHDALERMRKLVEEGKKVQEANRQISTIDLNEQRGDLFKQAGRAQKITALQAGPGAEYQTIQRSYEIRLSLGKQIFDLDMKAASQEDDINKRRVDQARAYADLRREEQDAELEKEQQLLEISQKRREEVGNFASGLSAAARSGNTSQYIRNFFGQTADKIVGNAAQSLYKPGMFSVPGQTNADGSPTFLGKLLAGTMFAPDKGNPVQKSTDDNTKATVDNTTALGAVYGALGGDPSQLPNSQSSVAIPFFGSGGSSASSSISGILGALGIRSSGGSGYGNSPGSDPGWIFDNKIATDDMSNPNSSGGGGGIASGAGSFFQSLFGGGGGSGNGGGGGGIGGFDNSISQDDSSNPTSSGDSSGQLSGGPGLGAGLAMAGAAYQGVSSAIKDFKKGGARGTIGGIGDVAGTVAMFDPEPISKAVLEGVALTAKVVTAFMGDPRLERQTQIQKNLFNDQYLAPAAMNRTMDSSGNYSDLDFRGNVRTSNLSSIPQIAPAFMDYRNQVAVPQRITSPFGGGGAGNVNINIQALDGQDVKRVLMNNPEAVADSVQNAVYKGGSALADTMRNL